MISKGIPLLPLGSFFMNRVIPAQWSRAASNWSISYPARPGFTLIVVSGEEEIAAGIDGEVMEGLQLARGQIHGQALGHSAQVQGKGTATENGLSLGIQLDVAIAAIAVGGDGVSDNGASHMMAIEAAGVHAMTDGGIKGPTRFGRDKDGKLCCFEKDGADRDRHANLQLHQLACRIEAGTALFYFLEPTEGAADGVVGTGGCIMKDSD